MNENEIIQTFLKGIKEADELIKNGIDVNTKDSNSWSAVEHAIDQGKSEIVEFLLDNGAEILEHDALIRACTSGQEDIVLLLLKRFHSAERRQNNEDHQYALEYCLTYFVDKPNKFKLIEQILNYAGNLTDYGKYYYEPLLVACEGGNEDVIRLLLSRGADLHCRDIDGNGNALHWAARSDNSNLVGWLLNEGFEVNEEDKSGNNALSVAVLYGNTNIVELLLKNGAIFNFSNCKPYFSPLHSACEYGDETILKLIIEAGVDINKKWELYDCTPLQIATQRGQENIVNLLLNVGADIAVLNSSGESLLHLAVTSQKEKLVELFLQRGLKVNAKCEYGRTVLELACHYSNTKIIQLLMQYATDMGEDLYLSALKGAIEYRRENVVKLLLESASLYDINMRDICAKKLNEVTIFRHIMALLLTNTLNLEQNKDAAQLLIKWIVKASVNNLEEWAEDYNAISLISQFFSSYWDNCKKELQVSKDELIKDTCVTFADIMESPLSRLASFTKNESIAEALNSKNLDTKFPIYAFMIREAFEKGMERRMLEDKTRRVFHSLVDKDDCKLPKLPDTFIHSVLGYLSNNDLYNFTQ